MADLTSILKDPNYTGANAATKQAIFDKFASQDLNFTNANPQTQSAIRAKFGLTVEPTVTPELTTTQKVWQAARPYVAPLVEGAGALGGGILGGAAGTFGAGPVGTAVGGVAGAGLGYGMGKELMNIGDVSLGGKAPRQGIAQVTEPIQNIAEGATYEAGGRALGPALGWAAGKVAGLRQLPAQKAASIAKASLGADLPTVLNNLRTAPANASIAELTAGIENPTWQSLIQRSLERDPASIQTLRKLAATDEAAATNALAKLAGGSTATSTRTTNALAKENLNAITSPMRESAISRANLGKYVADEATVRQANDLAVAASTGGKIDPAQFVAQATGAEKALRSVGVKPLEAESLANSIAAIPKNPSFAANDLIEGSTQEVANAIRQWTGNGGVIDANALEAIRKNAVNAAIARLRPGMDATAQRNAAAGVMSDIKPMIDNAIEAAGGKGWREYLATHAKGMQQIAEKKLNGEALNLWKTDKDAFVKLVQGESPDVVEKILGPGRYDIAKEVADSTLEVLQKQAQQHLTKMSVASQADDGAKALATVMEQHVSKFKLPSLLNFWSTVGNKTLEILERKVGQKTMSMLTEAAKTPEGMTKLLETMPASERTRVIDLLSNPAKWTSGKAAATLVTGKNMLAPEVQNENALAQ